MDKKIFTQLYGDQILASRYKHKILSANKAKLTDHAKCRLAERLNTEGIPTENVVEDINSGIRRAIYMGSGRFKVFGKLAKYIITKDKVVITIYKYRKDTD